MTLDEMRKLPSKEVWKIAHDIQNADRECARCVLLSLGYTGRSWMETDARARAERKEKAG